MTDADARAEVARLRAEGLTMASIADRMNDAGYVSPKGGKWSPGTVQRALTWKPPPDKQDFNEINNPHEILKADPSNAAARLDLADRANYFRTGKYNVPRIRAIQAQYTTTKVK